VDLSADSGILRARRCLGKSSLLLEDRIPDQGDFSIVVFNENDGQLSTAVSSEHIGKVSAYLKMQQLSELRQLIVTAKSKL
jgi:hypothetical protein